MPSNTLTNDQLKEKARNIAEPTFKFMKRLINRELDGINDKDKMISMNSLLNLIITSLSSLDANILVMTRDVIKKSGADFDFVKVLYVYFEDIKSILTQEELMKIKEKMN